MIKVGDSIPEVKLTRATADGPRDTTSAEVFGGKTVVLFAVPGAFTPTCSAKHLPGYLHQIDALKAKGVDTIACVSVNDAFVMQAWSRDNDVDGRVEMLADGSAGFTKALGLEMDLTARNMGVRSQRYAMVVKDGKVAALSVEEPGVFEVSRAEAILEAL